jgi:hypothetical protein
MPEVISMSRDLDDRLDRLLRQAFREGVPEPESEADTAAPEPIPSDLYRRLLARADELTGQLLAIKVLEAGESIGWGPKELTVDASGYEREARELLMGKGEPLQFPPEVIARLLWRVELGPTDWEELLIQLVASQVTFDRPVEGSVWARTTGLSDEARQAALTEGKPERNPARAERVARAFVEEVVEEWTSLTSGKKTIEDDEE